VRHVAAVTKAGRFFTWGNGEHGCLGHSNWSKVELRLKRVKNGGFVELFIVCAAANVLCTLWWGLAPKDTSFIPGPSGPGVLLLLVCRCWIFPINSYRLIWTNTNFLLFYYPRYCHCAVYSQSLLVLLSFLWTLRYDAIHFVRDLKRIGC
jgi:hypothetical protein